MKRVRGVGVANRGWQAPRSPACAHSALTSPRRIAPGGAELVEPGRNRGGEAGGRAAAEPPSPQHRPLSRLVPRSRAAGAMHCDGVCEWRGPGCEDRAQAAVRAAPARGGWLRQHRAPLARLHRTQMRLSEDDIMGIFIQLCLALRYLHEQNILHRDIKSQVRDARPCPPLRRRPGSPLARRLCSAPRPLRHDLAPERFPHAERHCEAGRLWHRQDAATQQGACPYPDRHPFLPVRVAAPPPPPASPALPSALTRRLLFSLSPPPLP